MDYLFRTADSLLEANLETFGATLIEGPKWCGKTTTASQKAASVLQMQDPDKKASYLETIKVKPSLLLLGETPRLIDEWQVAPELWDAVRVAVDKRTVPGQFILTGSNAVKRNRIQHTGTGRIARMKMYPMSLFESKDGSGAISLKELFDNADMDIDGTKSPMTVEQLVFAACRGGWPASLMVSKEDNKLRIANTYIDSVCDTDISTIEALEDDSDMPKPRKRDSDITRAILRSYARNISTLAKTSNILKDIKAQDETLTDKTLNDYLYALRRLFVIEDVEAWCPAIRSASAIRSGVKREFTDPSIAVAALGLAPDQLLMDMKTFGFIFETMCARDIRAYSQELGGRLNYYHDRYNLEADFVLHLRDGRYALVECKLGSEEIAEGAEHLLEIRELIKEKNLIEKQVPIREPDLMIVLTGGEMAYTRPDGVRIIPLACLRP